MPKTVLDIFWRALTKHLIATKPEYTNIILNIKDIVQIKRQFYIFLSLTCLVICLVVHPYCSGTSPLIFKVICQKWLIITDYDYKATGFKYRFANFLTSRSSRKSWTSWLPWLQHSHYRSDPQVLLTLGRRWFLTYLKRGSLALGIFFSRSP